MADPRFTITPSTAPREAFNNLSSAILRTRQEKRLRESTKRGFELQEQELQLRRQIQQLSAFNTQKSQAVNSFRSNLDTAIGSGDQKVLDSVLGQAKNNPFVQNEAAPLQGMKINKKGNVIEIDTNISQAEIDSGKFDVAGVAPDTPGRKKLRFFQKGDEKQLLSVADIKEAGQTAGEDFDNFMKAFKTVQTQLSGISNIRAGVGIRQARGEPEKVERDLVARMEALKSSVKGIKSKFPESFKQFGMGEIETFSGLGPDAVIQEDIDNLIKVTGQRAADEGVATLTAKDIFEQIQKGGASSEGDFTEAGFERSTNEAGNIIFTDPETGRSFALIENKKPQGGGT